MKVEHVDIGTYLPEHGYPVRVVTPSFYCTQRGRPVTNEKDEICVVPLFGGGQEVVDQALGMMKLYVERVAPVPDEWTITVLRVVGSDKVGIVASDKYIEVM
jgi:hypothetical protein